MGRQLSRRLKLCFLDSDNAVEERLGCAIREYFEREGEDRFRDVEQHVIDELTQRNGCVISTGGGVVLRRENRCHLLGRCKTVYLHATPDEIFRRLRHDQIRPLLQVPNPLDKLKQLYDQRDSLYREVAHFVVQTDRPSIKTLIDLIVVQLELAGALEYGSKA